MKRKLAFCLVLILAVCCLAPAFGEGKLKVTKKNFYKISSGSYAYGYVMAQVENVGDKPVQLKGATMEIFDKAGEVLGSTDSYSCPMKYLQPGEHTYLKMYASLDPEKLDDVEKNKLSLSDKSDLDRKCIVLPCEFEFKKDVKEGYSTHDYMYATVTNNTDQPLYSIMTTFAMKDKKENILFVTSNSFGSSQALMPGSSVLIKMEMDYNFRKYCEENNKKVKTIDVQAYCYVNKD